MRAKCVPYLALVFAFLMIPAGGSADQPADFVGLTADRLRAKLGPPHRMARQILYRRVLEMWVYTKPQPLWIELEHIRGHPMRVRRVYHKTPEKPPAPRNRRDKS